MSGYRILDSQALAPDVTRLTIEAPHVVRNCKAGQFVIVRATPDGERIPLTIADSSPRRGAVTLIIQAIGLSTQTLCSLRSGERIADIAGPMGRPTDIGYVGHAVVVGGGVGTAVVYPQAAALNAHGNKVSAVIGGRSKQYVILESELQAVCDQVYPCTNDGSYGHQGFVTEKLCAVIEESRETSPVRLVLAAGPVPMMRAVAELTRPYGIHTVASLNPIMVDGTGMCGGCRVMVGNQVQFACVDGPEFDAHQVDFNELADRLTAYRAAEAAAVRRSGCKCRTLAEKVASDA